MTRGRRIAKAIEFFFVMKLGWITTHQWIIYRSLIHRKIGKVVCWILRSHKHDLGVSFKARKLIDLCPRCFHLNKVRMLT